MTIIQSAIAFVAPIKGDVVIVHPHDDLPREVVVSSVDAHDETIAYSFAGECYWANWWQLSGHSIY